MAIKTNERANYSGNVWTIRCFFLVVLCSFFSIGSVACNQFLQQVSLFRVPFCSRLNLYLLNIILPYWNAFRPKKKSQIKIMSKKSGIELANRIGWHSKFAALHKRKFFVNFNHENLINYAYAVNLCSHFLSHSLRK